MNGALMPLGVLAQNNDPFADPRTMALLQGGLGMMAASGPSRTPVGFGQVLGQGGQGALQGYSQAQMAQKQNALMAMQMAQLQKELQKQAALQALIEPQGPRTPLPQIAMAEGASMGDIGPTVTNGARLSAMQNNPVLQSGYQPIPADRLAAAAGAGVNIDPFIKLNAEARPDLHFQDTGSEIRVIDKKSMKLVDTIKKGAAPGAVPFEASDQTPAAYRDFMLSRANAGASRNIQNVNAFAPASEEAQRDFMRSTRTNYEALRNAPVTLKNIEDAKALVPGAKGFMGPAGESLLEGAKFLKNRLGIEVNTAGVKDAEELRSRIFFQIMDNLKKMDAQPSQQQQEVMKNALGSLGTDPNALPAVLDAFAEAIRGKVDIHNREVESAIRKNVQFPYDPIIRLPEIKKAEEAPKPPPNRIRYDARGNRL